MLALARVVLATGLAWLTLTVPGEAMQQGQPTRHTTEVWVAACQAQAALVTPIDVSAACACSAGLLGGRLSTRQYTILGFLAPRLATQAGLTAEITRLVEEEGYSATEVRDVGNLIGTLQPEVDRVCGVLESRPR